MNSRVCIDASLAIKLVLPEHDSEVARTLWQEWITAKTVRIAPPLFLSEGLSVIRNRTYRKQILLDEAEALYKAFTGLPVTVITPVGLTERTWQLATKFDRPNIYDCNYLALAELEGCDFWTADERLYNIVKTDCPWVKLLRDFRVV